MLDNTLRIIYRALQEEQKRLESEQYKFSEYHEAMTREELDILDTAKREIEQEMRQRHISPRLEYSEELEQALAELEDGGETLADLYP